MQNTRQKQIRRKFRRDKTHKLDLTSNIYLVYSHTQGSVKHDIEAAETRQRRKLSCLPSGQPTTKLSLGLTALRRQAPTHRRLPNIRKGGVAGDHDDPDRDAMITTPEWTTRPRMESRRRRQRLKREGKCVDVLWKSGSQASRVGTTVGATIQTLIAIGVILPTESHLQDRKNKFWFSVQISWV